MIDSPDVVRCSLTKRLLNQYDCEVLCDIAKYLIQILRVIGVKVQSPLSRLATCRIKDWFASGLKVTVCTVMLFAAASRTATSGLTPVLWFPSVIKMIVLAAKGLVFGSDLNELTPV